MRMTKLRACLSKCSTSKGCGWWSHSIYLSISLLYTVKREETNVCMAFGWQTLPFRLSSPPFFLSFAFLAIEQGLRNKTCVQRYTIQQCMLLSRKTLSAISAFCLTSCLILFSYIQINEISTYYSFKTTVKMIISPVDDDVVEEDWSLPSSR
jgi:hypothetical protein